MYILGFRVYKYKFVRVCVRPGMSRCSRKFPYRAQIRVSNDKVAAMSHLSHLNSRHISMITHFYKVVGRVV